MTVRAVLLLVFTLLAVSPTKAQETCALPPGSYNSYALGLRACLTQPLPVYAANQALGVKLSAARDVLVELWLIDAEGQRMRLAPLDGERTIRVRTGETVAVDAQDYRGLRAGSRPGRYELRVTARPAPRGGMRSAVDLASADAELAGEEFREDRRLFLTVKPR